MLTDSLHDGTTGMLAIKQSGGTCIAQASNEGEYLDMAPFVLNNMELDHCITRVKMGDAFFFTTQTEPA